jgi:hypothetical protein
LAEEGGRKWPVAGAGVYHTSGRADIRYA